jgi:hypothetical protein
VGTEVDDGRTHLEREPKVGARHIDLLKLYKRVVEEGGYDKMCDKRGKPLAWRHLTAEFLPGSSTLTTQAFIVKSVYYKNLACDLSPSTLHQLPHFSLTRVPARTRSPTFTSANLHLRKY